MATKTTITHPAAAAQSGQFYPFTVTIKGVAGSTVAGPFACAYDAATGNDVGTFEDEAPANDKILIPSWEPTLKAKLQAILDMEGTKRKFEILDVMPQGNPPSQTLLIVSSQNG
jgi:hypothetical protein